MVLPGRQCCEEVWDECLEYVYSSVLNITAPEHIQCTNFPVEATETDDFLIACPDPSKSNLLLWPVKTTKQPSELSIILGTVN